MDFIPELPESKGHDNVLVIVDKLTKYTIFIPTTTTVTEKGTAELFFRHIISQYGIPWQVISKFWQGCSVEGGILEGNMWKNGNEASLDDGLSPPSQQANWSNEPDTWDISSGVYWA